MGRILFFKWLKEKMRTGSIILVCVCMISLLLSACVGGSKKQSAFGTNDTGQVSAKDEFVSSKTEDVEEIECRRQKATGSLFLRKVCLTKAQWAEVDKKNREETDRFDRDVKGGNDADIDMGETSIRTPR